MIDTIRLKLPLRESHVLPVFDSNGRLCGGEALNTIFKLDGVRVTAGEIQYDENGQISATRLNIPFQTIPSSNSTLAFKLYKGGHNYWPFVEINASAAKLIQGHNAYGTDNFDVCASAMLQIFFSNFDADWFDFENIEIKQIDCTYTAHVASSFISRQVIKSLSHISNGQTRFSKSYSTAVTFNEGSTYCMLEVYLKDDEVEHQINLITKKLAREKSPHYEKQLKALKSKEVQDFVKNSVRFEAKIRQEWLKYRGIPLRLIDFINKCNDEPDLIQKMWKAAFEPIFKTFEGQTMNIYDDEAVLKLLKNEYDTVNEKGRLLDSKSARLFRFFREIKTQGFNVVQQNYKRPTFYRNLSDLSVVVPKSQLQNIANNDKSNVVPLFKIINIDFAKQVPANFVEPEYHKLKLVV